MRPSSVVDAYPVAEGHCPHCGHLKPLWTPEAIILAAQRWFELHHRSPRRSDWHTAVPGFPTSSTIYSVFGSWRTFLRAAGLPQNKPPRRNSRWTRDEIVAAMQDFLAREGRWPTGADWEHAGDDHPCQHTVYRVFGRNGWTKAKLAAGWNGRLRRRYYGRTLVAA